MMLDYLLNRKNHLILLFTVGYVAAFTLNALVFGNIEFLYYTFLMVGLLYTALLVHQYVHLGFTILFSLSLLGLLHLAGGNFHLGPVRLYDVFVVPGLLRYDSLVHTFGTFIVTLLLYSLFADYISESVRRHYPLFAFLLVLMALGVGTLNELVEFLAVVFLGAAEQVGGYFNNSLDLLFNTLGSVLGTIVIYYYLERPKFIARLNEKFRKND